MPDGEFCLFCGDVLTESGRLLRIASPHGLAFQTSRGTIPFIVPTDDSREYAGFWRRVWAGLIDVCLEIVAAVLVVVVIYFIGRTLGVEHESAAYLTGFIFVPVLAVGGWLYAALSESSHYRATLGKRVMGLQVVNAAGGQLTFSQASVRHVMKFLSLFTLCVGFLMAGWTKRRQALHDMPNDCLVIRVPEERLSLFG